MPKDTKDQRFAEKLTTDIVFVGLNMSADGRPLPGSSLFQNTRGHERIIKTFFNTQAEGGYFTDIIKSDKRVLDKIENPANGSEVMLIVRDHPEILKEHIRIFKEELDYIGSVKPMLIVFGGYAKWCLDEGNKRGILPFSSFTDVVQIGSYSRNNRMTNNINDYITDTSRKLADYIIKKPGRGGTIMSSNMINGTFILLKWIAS